MKKREIEVGRAYRRGDVVKLLIGEGLELAPGGSGQTDRDCVEYQVLAGDWRSRMGRPVCTRRAFAQWAVSEVTGDELARLKAGEVSLD